MQLGDVQVQLLQAFLHDEGARNRRQQKIEQQGQDQTAKAKKKKKIISPCRIIIKDFDRLHSKMEDPQPGGGAKPRP